MKSTIELTVDSNGNPIIKIVNHDKSQNISDKLLKLFMEGAIQNGLTVKRIGSFASLEGDSTETFEIKNAL